MKQRLYSKQAEANGYYYSENTPVGVILYPKEKSNIEKELDKILTPQETKQK